MLLFFQVCSKWLPNGWHMAAWAILREKKKTTNLLFFQDSTWQPLADTCNHLQPLGSHLPRQPLGSHLLKQPCASRLAATCCNLEKSKIYKITFFFKIALGSHLAATWQPLAPTCNHLQPLGSNLPRQPLGSHLQPLAPSATCSHLQPLAATCSHLPRQPLGSHLQPLAATCSHLPRQPLAAAWQPLAATLAATCPVSHLQPLAATCSHLQPLAPSATCSHLQPLGSHWQPLSATVSHLQPLAATGSHLQPLAPSATCSHLQPLAATCSHLQPLAATWQPLTAATGASGCKWLTSRKSNCAHNVKSPFWLVKCPCIPNIWPYSAWLIVMIYPQSHRDSRFSVVLTWESTRRGWAKRPHAVLVLVPDLAQPDQVARQHAEAICRVASGDWFVRSEGGPGGRKKITKKGEEWKNMEKIWI